MDHHAHAADEGDDTAQAPTRPNYFHGKLLGDDDLTLEQSYFKAKLRRHNRLLHGWGVVAGLDVTAGASPTEVVVGPGYALDSSGEELLVPEPVVVDLAGTLPDGASYDGPFYLAMRYEEFLTAPTPSGEGEEEQYDRVEEGVEMALLNGLPDPFEVMPSPDFADTAQCSDATKERPFPPPAGDPWLILADIVFGDDGSVAGIDPLAHRRFVASFGEFSFSC
jgi:hypothetical protein